MHVYLWGMRVCAYIVRYDLKACMITSYPTGGSNNTVACITIKIRMQVYQDHMVFEGLYIHTGTHAHALNALMQMSVHTR